MSLKNFLDEVRYPNDEFLWFLNNPSHRSLLVALLDGAFPDIPQKHYEPLAEEFMHWLHLVHEDFIESKRPKE